MPSCAALSSDRGQLHLLLPSQRSSAETSELTALVSTTKGDPDPTLHEGSSEDTGFVLWTLTTESSHHGYLTCQQEVLGTCGTQMVLIL
jgi:hypothetical protein